MDREDIISPFKSVEYDIRVYSKDYNRNRYLNSIDTFIPKNYAPKATVFTIMYNTPGELLCRAIESVLSQTYKDFEYLVIDNGSTDESADIVRDYADKDERVKYIRLHNNMVWASCEILSVLSGNINTEYVAMLDPDDYYEAEFLERTISIAEKEDAEIRGRSSCQNPKTGRR